MIQKAYFCGGCFWGTEYYFKQIKGVLKTTVGYMGGHLDHPTYKDVKTQTTGHYEANEITFDSDEVSYTELLKLFFEIHDFEQINGQGVDIGPQYRSAIFYVDEQQHQEAEAVIELLKQKGYKPATVVLPYQTYYLAEDYHQDYLGIAGRHPECHAWRKVF